MPGHHPVHAVCGPLSCREGRLLPQDKRERRDAQSPLKIISAKTLLFLFWGIG